MYLIADCTVQSRDIHYLVTQLQNCDDDEVVLTFQGTNILVKNSCDDEGDDDDDDDACDYDHDKDTNEDVEYESNN